MFKKKRYYLNENGYVGLNIKFIIELRVSLYNPVWEGCVIPSMLNIQFTCSYLKIIIKYYFNENLYVVFNINFKHTYTHTHGQK